jgi:hypothetical protein
MQIAGSWMPYSNKQTGTQQMPYCEWTHHVAVYHNGLAPSRIQTLTGVRFSLTTSLAVLGRSENKGEHQKNNWHSLEKYRATWRWRTTRVNKGTRESARKSESSASGARLGGWTTVAVEMESQLYAPTGAWSGEVAVVSASTDERVTSQDVDTT